ncbi:hypothetical protein CRE_26032 [Caenorhabditis remanei]|uniref:Uncharacterized protein n=1 Tax=Caenorhabditis remanei TaxID=31234 RepID=E3NVN1_CAERE|nr:hypothetical protein CRE_26032 [Caenorhabditis remanei]
MLKKNIFCRKIVMNKLQKIESGPTRYFASFFLNKCNFRESERAWPSPAPNVPQFRLPNAKVPKKRVRQESDQPGTAHATASRIKEEPIAEESSRRNNRERSHQAHSSGARIKAEPAEEAPELDRPPCEYTIPVPDSIHDSVPDSIHPNVPNSLQLVAPAPCPQASIPAPHAASLTNSGLKSSVTPHESPSEPMVPGQEQRRRNDEQPDRETDHQVKEGSSQRSVGRNQERDSLDSNRGNNLQNSKVGDQPEEPQIQRFDESGDQRMEIGAIPDEAEPELDLQNEPPVHNQDDLPLVEEQPKVEAAQEEPTEENDEMGPPQNEDQELDGNRVENDEEMDEEESEVELAIGRRRSAREKQPASNIQPKYGKNQITHNRVPDYHRKKAVLARSARNCKKYKKCTGGTKRANKCRLLGFRSHGRAMTVLIFYVSTIFQKVLSDKIACANTALQQRVSLPSQLIFKFLVFKNDPDSNKNSWIMIFPCIQIILFFFYIICPPFFYGF